MASSTSTPQRRTVRKMVKTRILIISDTHAALPSDHNAGSLERTEEEDRIPYHLPLPAADVLLHCGDLTMNGSIAQHNNALNLITSVRADLKLIIPGNHDITLDRAYYKAHPRVHASWDPPYSETTLDEIQGLYTGPKVRADGVRYLVEGVCRYRLKNGARLGVYASAYQPEFWNWAFGYARGVDRFNLDLDSGTGTGLEESGAGKGEGEGEGTGEKYCPVPDFDDGERSIDIMLTHGPPHGILDKTMSSAQVGCEHLRRAVERCRPRLHCFGHIHEAWGAVRKTWEGEPPKISTGERRIDETGSEEKSISKSTPQEQSTQTTAANLHPHPLRTEIETQPTYNSASSKTHAPLTASTPSTRQRDPNTNTNRNETVLEPAPFDTRVAEMCAFVDATDLCFGAETLFVNASVMNLEYRPVSAPWVVDLMLPVWDEDVDGEGGEGDQR